MPLTGSGKNVAINALASAASPTGKAAAFISILERTLEVTGWGQKSTTILEKTAHGLSNNDLVWFTAIVGGAVDAANPTTTPGIIVKRPYFVKVVGANEIELLYTRGGATAVKWNTTVTSGTLMRFAEITSGPTVRVATAFSTATIAVATDAARKLKVKGASQNVDALAWYPKSKASEEGSSEPEPVAALEITRETFAAEGELEVTSTSFDLLANGSLA